MHRIKAARARPGFTVEVEWDDGDRSTVSFAGAVGKGVAGPLADPAYFVGNMTVGGEGDWLAWPNDVDFAADSLWYKAHPADLKRDYGETEATE